MLAGVDAAVEAMRAGQADAIALSRESLTGLAAKIPGARVLDGGFLNSTTAVAVPKGHPEALGLCERLHRGSESVGPGAPTPSTTWASRPRRSRRPG